MAEPIYESGAWVYKMFITIIVAVVSIAIVSVAVVDNANTNVVQENLLLNRILYSPDGFWYEQDGVTYPGIVDMSKFGSDQMQETMDKNFKYLAGYGGALIALDAQDGAIPFHQVYINKRTFSDIKTAFTGIGSNPGIVETHVYPVLIRNGNQEVNGWLSVEVAVPAIA